MASEEQLKCGCGSEVYIEQLSQIGIRYVACRDCGMYGPNADSDEAAITAFRLATRADEIDELLKIIDTLQKQIKVMI